MRALAVLACCAGLVLPVAGIYCKVGYGQRIKQNSREINFWVKTMVRSALYFAQINAPAAIPLPCGVCFVLLWIC